jgi:hypothetical protein
MEVKRQDENISFKSKYERSDHCAARVVSSTRQRSGLDTTPPVTSLSKIQISDYHVTSQLCQGNTDQVFKILTNPGCIYICSESKKVTQLYLIGMAPYRNY